jgi:hypothetical protein
MLALFGKHPCTIKKQNVQQLERFASSMNCKSRGIFAKGTHGHGHHICVTIIYNAVCHILPK